MTTDTQAADQPTARNATVNDLLFGFKGRASRLQFWLVHLAAVVMIGLFWAIVNVERFTGGSSSPTISGLQVLKWTPWVIAALLLWPLTAIGVKRCHDRGQSGWWMLLMLVPGVNLVWEVINLGILPGQSADNRFGAAASGRDQATKDIRTTSVMFVLGFAAGLPALLVFDTLSIWLREADLSLKAISLFGLATLATAMKFLWAPLIDRTKVPFLTQWLGHRRSWMLVSQAVIILGLWLIAGTDPKTSLGLMAVFAVMVGFASANQDIVIDAWRIEASDDSRQGPMAAAYQWGYRVAIIVAGAVPLILATAVSWRFSYFVMAGLMVVGVAAVLAAPREAVHKVRPIQIGDVPARPALETVEWAARLLILAIGGLLVGSGLAGSADFIADILARLGAAGAGESLKAAWESDAKIWFQLTAIIAGFLVIAAAAMKIPRAPTRPGAYLSGALGQPITDFVGRYGKVAGLILALICLYRVSDFVININGAFYLDLGFSKLEIAEIRKVFGVVMSVIGVGLGGFTVARLGLMRALIVGGFAGTLSNLAFAWLATQGHSIPALMIAIAFDNIGGGIAGTCLIAYMSSLTAAGFTATQYALFSSLYALPGKLLASQSGQIVEGSARAMEPGGSLAALRGLFAALPPESYAEAMSRSGVSPVSLGGGYMVFYLYSTVIGVFAIVLSFIVAAKQPAPKARAVVETEAA